MLVTMKELLQEAEKKNKAIGAFNVSSFDFMQGVIMAAEELNSPVIIQYAPGHRDYISLEDAGHAMLYLAKKSKLPICVHLDHGDNVDDCIKAIDLGFSSVMYDGSQLPFEENIKNTKYVTEYAHKHGVSVEAEIGSMPHNNNGELTDYKPEDYYTNPEDAKYFYEQTHVDALAISFGTVHGIYREKPKLSIDVIKKVKEYTKDLPLVMHGGSGLSDEDYHNVINAGIRKINFYTYSARYAGKKAYELMQNNPDGLLYQEIVITAREAVKEETERAIKLFNNK